jgi:hypothetical protein
MNLGMEQNEPQDSRTQKPEEFSLLSRVPTFTESHIFRYVRPLITHKILSFGSLIVLIKMGYDETLLFFQETLHRLKVTCLETSNPLIKHT